MPKLIDYSARVDCIREAVYLITLSEGPDAISLPAVARQLAMSESSVRRILASATYLPELGLMWVERSENRRTGTRVEGEFGLDSRGGPAANQVLRLLPATAERLDDARVWRSLTSRFAEDDWALAAVRNRQLLHAVVLDNALPPELSPADHDYEYARLSCLLLGVIEAACTGAIRCEEAVPLVVRHLSTAFPAWLATPRSGAA